MQRGRSPVSVSDLIVSGLLRPGQELRFRQTPTVAVVAPDGKLNIDGRAFASPSTAAAAVLGGTATNGWLAWYLEEGEGRRSLAQLRDHLDARTRN